MQDSSASYSTQTVQRVGAQERLYSPKLLDAAIASQAVLNSPWRSNAMGTFYVASLALDPML